MLLSKHFKMSLFAYSYIILCYKPFKLKRPKCYCFICYFSDDTRSRMQQHLCFSTYHLLHVVFTERSESSAQAEVSGITKAVNLWFNNKNIMIQTETLCQSLRHHHPLGSSLRSTEAFCFSPVERHEWKVKYYHHCWSSDHCWEIIWK